MDVKVNKKMGEFGAGVGIGSVTGGPVMSALMSTLGGQSAQIMGSIGYGIGCLMTAALTVVATDKIFDR